MAAAPGRIFARNAQRLLALAACIRHNWRTGADDRRSLIAYDHCHRESLIRETSVRPPG